MNVSLIKKTRKTTYVKSEKLISKAFDLTFFCPTRNRKILTTLLSISESMRD